MFRLSPRILGLGTAVSVLLGTLALPPAVLAAAPGPVPGTPTHTVSTSAANAPIAQRVPVVPNPTWLAAKNAHRIVAIGGKPGHAGVPHLTAMPLNTLPSAANLTLDSNASGTWEPSDGSSPNNGAGDRQGR